MGFMDSYKQLEKLCGDMLGEGRVSAYIKEMSDKPRGAYLVSGWENDLKRLRHCRRIRNQIAHEPDCSETDMCLPEDAKWLDDFYARIMNQTDPLALYYKYTHPSPKYTKPAAKAVNSDADTRPTESGEAGTARGQNDNGSSRTPSESGRDDGKNSRKDTIVVVLIAIAAVLALLLIEWISAGRG